MDLILSLMVTIVAFCVLWMIHLPLKNAGIADVYWGVGFVMICAIYVIRGGQFSSYQLLLIVMVSVWAARLSTYLIKRFVFHRDEDARYAVMRATGGKTFWWASLPKIFILQALVLWIIATPLHTSLSSSPTPNENNFLMILGVALFCVGLSIETIADHQLARFKDANPASDKLLRTGLWAWSRHPNYFGEALLWWGLGLYALALSGSLISLLGPLALTVVLVGITGRLTDDHMQYSRKADYSGYKLQTSGFLLLPPTVYQHFTKKGRPVT